LVIIAYRLLAMDTPGLAPHPAGNVLLLRADCIGMDGLGQSRTPAAARVSEISISVAGLGSTVLPASGN
jgi:hypothetical protein